MMQVKPMKDAKVETIRYFIKNYMKEGVFLNQYSYANCLMYADSRAREQSVFIRSLVHETALDYW
jgi:cell fate (sporulation/competence/biofilm development) regulator YmcA (YheA/YmcA/DUF963 family)